MYTLFCRLRFIESGTISYFGFIRLIFSMIYSLFQAIVSKISSIKSDSSAMFLISILGSAILVVMWLVVMLLYVA